MNTLSINTLIVATLLVVAALAIAAWIFIRQRRSQRLQERFGAEYAHTVTALGGRTKAETELKERESRMARLSITPLAAPEAARFTQAWDSLQRRFIDNPKGVVAEADHLITELLAKRGYPTGDFEHRAADLSVDHPSIVSAYRAAQLIAARDQRGEADTEELRKAVVHYRTLFDELLGVDRTQALDLPAARILAHS